MRKGCEAYFLFVLSECVGRHTDFRETDQILTHAVAIYDDQKWNEKTVISNCIYDFLISGVHNKRERD